MDTLSGNDPMVIPPHSPLAGLDPAALLQQGAAEDTLGGGHSFVPPELEEMADHFPQFEILELIGQGGMGAVYKVRQNELDRVVALKILPPAISEAPGFSDRFTLEAKALAKLNHPGIVTIHEFGQRDGLYFILMEYVDGVNLAQLMKSGRIAPREALAIVPQICDALQFAHDRGIVHRDIKPENILLDRLGRVKVADFGIAKVVASVCDRRTDQEERQSQTDATLAGKVLGTPQYMAPEQIEHPADVDHRADIYALGVVFYQMLTGELPGKELQAPSKKFHIDVRLDEIVMHALEKNPELRFQQASVMKSRVESLANKPIEPIKETPVSPLAKSNSTGWMRYVVTPLAIILVPLMAWTFATKYMVWKQEKQRIALQHELNNLIGTLLGEGRITCSKVDFAHESTTALWELVVNCEGLESWRGPTGESLVKPRTIKGNIVLNWQPPDEWSAMGKGDLKGLDATWHTVTKGFPEWPHSAETSLSVSDPMHPLLRVTVRVLDVPAAFDDSQLLRPTGLLDSDQMKILAAPYVVVPSGGDGKIQINEIPGLGNGFSPVLSGRTKTLYVKPTLEPGTAHVRYSLEGMVREPGADDKNYKRQGIRSDSLQLGELQIMESNSENGRKQLAVISAEMEVMKVDATGNTVPTGTNVASSASPYDTFVERVRKELSRVSVRFDKLHISMVDNECFIVSFSGLEAHCVVNKKDAWVSLLGPGSLEAKRSWSGNQWNFRGLEPLASVRFTVAVLDVENLLEINLAEAMPAATPEATFGPVIDQVVPFDDKGVSDFFDLDSGKIAGPQIDTPAGLSKLNSSAMIGFSLDERMMMTTSAIGLQALENGQWDSLNVEQVKAGVEKIQFTPALHMESLPEDKLPKTFLFQTRASGKGLLQITGYTENPRGVRIRYKLEKGKRESQLRR